MYAPDFVQKHSILKSSNRLAKNKIFWSEVERMLLVYDRQKIRFRYLEFRAVSQQNCPVARKRYLDEGMWRCGCDFFVVKISL